ncbi:glycine zipper 2TM domain-containing protein [Novosphingobium mangrovi (ex Huang et al. 2023)]|uniref:17 kDa surface antigen n=1 Tax=Novosphingobium mangrovi (ex Huang et al. 2023) TaxID=2976432 RepID=A0ABT2I4U9_9SPHN|nr:glycine zipper 2TM domain-containing protein [Novosphingobium mangrovi (ex Huang et al. 2023)]MCT2399833.1 glycine zipper 2TM domain-containing protein [Novosphingobium mangrovi (ex Huang et al. 2023)]
MKKMLLALAMATLALPAVPAAADPPPWAPAHGKRAHDRDYRDQRRDYRNQRIYDSRGRYLKPHRITRNSHVWRGRDGRYYCRRDNGTTGLIIGAGVGALAGHELAGNGDRTLGALLGGVIGGVLGREIDRGSLSCR